MISNNFASRHNGVSNPAEEQKMLDVIGVKTMDELIEKAVPAAIRLKEAMPLPEGMSEYQFLNHVRSLAQKNKLYKSYIGMGYYGTVTPAVIMRNVFENPGWYTSYTPYQTEISQGRLEALMNYQTMIASMTGMPLISSAPGTGRSFALRPRTGSSTRPGRGGARLSTGRRMRRAGSCPIWPGTRCTRRSKWPSSWAFRTRWRS